MLFITARKRSCGKVMFLHLSISHSVHRRGVSASGSGVSAIPMADTPLGRHPARQTPPGSSGQTPPSAPSIEMTIEAAGMRPTGMHSCCEHNLNCLVILLAQRKPIA